MRRRFALFSLSAALLAILFVANPVPSPVTAQEGTPTTASHPIIGSWIVDVDTNNQSDPPELAVFSADGTYLQVDAGGFTSGVGVWKATGPSSANFTFLNITARGEELVSTAKVRGTVVVDGTGDRFTAQATVEVVVPSGATSHELGPIQASATRIVVEPMGTPFGPVPSESG